MLGQCEAVWRATGAIEQLLASHQGPTISIHWADDGTAEVAPHASVERSHAGVFLVTNHECVRPKWRLAEDPARRVTALEVVEDALAEIRSEADKRLEALGFVRDI